MSVLMLTLLLAGMLTLSFDTGLINARYYAGYGKGEATFYVTPQYSNFTIPPTANGTWFAVDVRIADATFVAGWQVEMLYKKEFLYTVPANISYATDMIFPSGKYQSVTPVVSVLNATHNYALITSLSLPYQEYNATDAGLFRVHFQIIKIPAENETLSSSLYLAVQPIGMFGSWTIDYDFNDNDLTIYDGYYQIYGIPPPTAYLGVQPNESTVGSRTLPLPTPTFAVNITVSDVTDLYEWKIKLNYNDTILEAVEVSLPTYNVFGANYTLLEASINNTIGFVQVSARSSTVGVNGSGVLCQVVFRGIGAPILETTFRYGLSDLEFDPEVTLLKDSEGTEITFNHEQPAGTVRVEALSVHDVSTTSVTPSKTVVGQGYCLNISVTVANQGDYTETSNVTVYGNANYIASQNVTLASGASETITFLWNTTGLDKSNYPISAYATPVSWETDTLDNNCTDGTALVTVPGDIDGDKKVDGKDIAIIAKYFGSASGYPPNADITNDGEIDGKDIAIAAKYFGTHEP